MLNVIAIVSPNCFKFLNQCTKVTSIRLICILLTISVLKHLNIFSVCCINICQLRFLSPQINEFNQFPNNDRFWRQIAFNQANVSVENYIWDTLLPGISKIDNFRTPETANIYHQMNERLITNRIQIYLISNVSHGWLISFVVIYRLTKWKNKLSEDK